MEQGCVLGYHASPPPLLSDPQIRAAAAGLRRRSRPDVDLSIRSHMDWEALTNAELLALSGGALAELRERDVVRTANAPAGDLAERLVADAMGGKLAHNSQKSWDVLVPAPSPTPRHSASR